MFFKVKFKIFLTLFFLLSFVVNSHSIEPNEFVQNTVNRASEALGNKISTEVKIK